MKSAANPYKQGVTWNHSPFAYGSCVQGRESVEDGRLRFAVNATQYADLNCLP